MNDETSEQSLIPNNDKDCLEDMDIITDSMDVLSAVDPLEALVCTVVEDFIINEINGVLESV